MGTNYYAIPKLSESKKIEIIKSVIDEQVDNLRLLVPNKIHLGKSSGGWPFLFNHNDWEYFESISQFYEFISNCEIIDEYGDAISLEELKEMIEKKQKSGIDKFTNSEYSDHYIIKDGYCFSTSTDFS